MQSNRSRMFGNINKSALPFDTQLDIQPNLLQDNPKDKPIPRKITPPNRPVELKDKPNRRARRNGISHKTGLAKRTGRSNQYADPQLHRRRRVRGKGK